MEIIYETQRLVARYWSQEDMHYALQLWGNSQVTQKIFKNTPDENTVAKILQVHIESQKVRGIQYWPHFLKESNEFIGCCGLRPYGVTDSDDRVELGFHICEEHWRKGFAKEAALGAINYAKRLGINALHAGHHPDNVGSKSLLKFLGFEFVEDIFYAQTGLMHPSYKLLIK